MTFDNGDLAIVNGSVNRNVEAGKTAVVGIQETPASSPPNSIDSAPTAQAPATGVLPALLILSVFLSLAAIIRQEVKRTPSWSKTEDEESISPCRSCRFFQANRYLKCAVNPTLVATSEAKFCQDYASKGQ
ncbi:MAG: hypothetical protein HLUCCA11_13740 [Phormidesmis priestleyi Ana]|uniref:Uncharacterized protein n=1 Tax=Phormidesmis priestleyi Ana TaxID=1666911 RepID=A0A0P7ZJF2_9CYAN|nr:MAG: hypothetical protein HLUCCA11_13740 [Phormidesmis priestleyi Ana]